MTASRATSYWVTGPCRGELRTTMEPRLGKVPLRAAYCAISSGTERLVGRGEVPPELSEKMACRGMEGRFPYPVKYGYSWVGRQENGRPVFTMHPHQDLIQVDGEHTITLPEELPLQRATLIPNLETALNGWWDAEVSDGESFLIVGGGVIGILLAYVAYGHRGEPALISETDPVRRKSLAALPWLEVTCPEAIADERFGVAMHCSGSGTGLQWSVDHLAFEGRVIELSWYGLKPVSLNLGTSFHYERKRIIASQVSTVSPAHRGLDAYSRRTERVLELLDSTLLDLLPGPFIPFPELPEAMARLYRGEHLGLHPVITYTGSI